MTTLPYTVLWLVFGFLVTLMLYIDLSLQRHSHAVSVKEAGIWSVIWVLVSLLFNGGIFLWLGPAKGWEFLTGYLLEKSLSVDNLFVFVIIFEYFAIPPRDQPRILKWGILGAVVMRFLFIFAGLELLKRFHWILYVFGGILVWSGVKMAFEKERKVAPEHNPAIRFFKRLMPITTQFEGARFFTLVQGIRHATPLFVTLLVVETSDIVFAVDSIPAVMAITRDSFIVYTSNVFAILGLRAMYFLLSAVLGWFRYLKTGISLILCFIGFKMLAVEFIPIPTVVSLSVVTAVLTLSMAASLIVRARAEG